MNASLRAGLTDERRISIDRDRTISFMGEEGRVYATPELVRDIEVTCRELLLRHVAEGEDSVGTAIAIQHSAPTPLGMSVWITVEIASIEGRLVNFRVSAKDEADPICKGTHSRFIVNKAKTIERLKAKGSKRSH
jgi:fluoroacetyl-CoA thioesterase